MRIGIDVSNLRAGGGITHLVEILRAADPHVNGFQEIVVWGGTKTLEAIEDKNWLHKVHDPLLDRALIYRVFWQRFRLKKLAHLAGCDVLFVPGGSDVSGFRPLVTMSRNLLPFERREIRRYGFTLKALKFLLLRYTQIHTYIKSDGLIFLTQYARDTVMKVMPRRPRRTTIIPHGIATRFMRPPRVQRRLEEFNESSPCRLLYVSVVELYKHQWHVVEAVAQLHAAGIPLVLDLVGSIGPGMARLQAALRRTPGTGEFVRYLGPVPYKRLHELYLEADINLFASSCENMPNILLEGMAAGLPIASSNRGPMPEVLGNAGIYFDPERPEDIAAALRMLIESSDLRAEKAVMAFKRAQQYSWVRCANDTFRFLAEVYESFRNSHAPNSGYRNEGAR